jgi:polysaccharide biosynthesis/export protein
MLGKKNVFIVIALSLGLSGCSNLPGNYFSIRQATQSITTNGKTYHPKIIPINSHLLIKTKDKKPTLWYKNNYSYKIGDDDVINIIVWDHPELNSPMASPINLISKVNANPLNTNQTNQTPGVLVNSQGNVYFPYAGTFHVAGKTTSSVRKELSKKLTHMIKDPQVSIRVSDFRSQYVNVMGAVLKPRAVTITDQPLTILNAINQAGGINKNSADTSHIFILRGTSAQPHIYLLDAKSPSNLLVSRRFKLYPSDIIYIPTTGLSNWNKIISNLLPSIQSASLTEAAIH